MVYTIKRAITDKEALILLLSLFLCYITLLEKGTEICPMYALCRPFLYNVSNRVQITDHRPIKGYQVSEIYFLTNMGVGRYNSAVYIDLHCT